MKYHIDESNNSRYDIILCRELLNALVLYLKFYENIIIVSKGTYEGCLATMFDLSNYNFTYITDKTYKPEESFINSYVNKCLESESTISSMRRILRTIDAKYKNSDLNTVMAKQCQHHKP